MPTRALLVAVAATAIALAGAAAPASADDTASLTVTVVTAHGVPVPFANATITADAYPSSPHGGQVDANGVETVASLLTGASTVTTTFPRSPGQASVTTHLDLAAGGNSVTVVLADTHIVAGSLTGPGAESVTSITADTAPIATSGTVGGTTAPVAGLAFSIVDTTAPYIDDQPFYYSLSGPGIVTGLTRPQVPAAVAFSYPFSLSVPIAAGAGTGSVVGRFVDAAGKPFSGQVVTLSANLSSATAAAPPTTVTDASGGFVFANLARGLYSVWGDSSTMSGWSAGARVDGTQQVNLGAVRAVRTAAKAAKTGALTAMVIDSQKWYLASYASYVDVSNTRLYVFTPYKAGKPIAAPILQIVDSHGVDFTYGGHTLKDAKSGEITTLPRAIDEAPLKTKKAVIAKGLPAGKYTVTLVGTGVTKKITVHAGKTTKLGTLTRPKAKRVISVKIATSGGRAPTPGFVAVGPGTLSPERAAPGRANTLPAIPGTYRVQAVRDTGQRYGPIKKVVVPKLSASHAAVKVTLTVPGSTALTGTVTATTGEPIAAMKVVLNEDPIAASRCEGTTDPDFAGETTTDAAGAFSITVPPSSGTRYAAVCDTYIDGYLATQSVWLIPPGTPRVALTASLG